MMHKPDPLALSRAKSRQARTGWRHALLDGMVGVDELLAAAATVEGKPLRRLGLREVLASRPGCSQVQANRILARLRMFLNVSAEELPTKAMTVAWLLDGRAAGRSEAWAMALAGATTVYEGFPFAERPSQ